MPRTPTIILCKECGRTGKRKGDSLCSACYDRRWRAENPGKNAEYRRKHYASHTEAHKATAERWRKAHPETSRANANRRRAADPERARALYRAWAAANPDKRRAYMRAWMSTNREKMNGYQHRREAQKRQLPGTLTPAEWRAILAAFGHKCAYCGQANKKLTQDHVQPLSKGGAYTVQNIVPACGPCNSRKHAGPPPKPVQTLLL